MVLHCACTVITGCRHCHDSFVGLTKWETYCWSLDYAESFWNLLSTPWLQLTTAKNGRVELPRIIVNFHQTSETGSSRHWSPNQELREEKGRKILLTHPLLVKSSSTRTPKGPYLSSRQYHTELALQAAPLCQDSTHNATDRHGGISKLFSESARNV